MATATAPRPNGATRKQQSLFRRVFLPVLIMLIGLAVLLYPVVSTQVNNRAQEAVTREYEAQAAAADAAKLNADVEAARKYNAEHTDGPILDPWLARVAEDNNEYQDYAAQLTGMPAMSQVVIPSIDVKLPVYHGTKEETLQKGLGHLFGSALPVGGEGMHSVITGHTGLTNATLFDDLVDVQVGDGIYVSTFGERMKYEVHDIEVVLPNEVDSLRAVEGQDLLTLITCTPYGVNTHRLLVHAHRVPLDDEDVFTKKTSIFQWWMWVLMAIAIVVIAALIWWIWRESKKEGIR